MDFPTEITAVSVALIGLYQSNALWALFSMTAKASYIGYVKFALTAASAEC